MSYIKKVKNGRKFFENKIFIMLFYTNIFNSFNKNKIYHIVILILITLCLIALLDPSHVLCQITSVPPVSYYYTNPLYYTGYGYINSITGPFYYLGYGYKPPVEGNTLLGWNTFTPYLDAYRSYLYNFFDLQTYGYPGSPYQTTFPYNTLAGRGNPYSRFVYPSYIYGSIDHYVRWAVLQ